MNTRKGIQFKGRVQLKCITRMIGELFEPAHKRNQSHMKICTTVVWQDKDKLSYITSSIDTRDHRRLLFVQPELTSECQLPFLNMFLTKKQILLVVLPLPLIYFVYVEYFSIAEEPADHTKNKTQGPASESPSPQNHVPQVKFLPDPQTSKPIPEIFQIESNRASDVPEQNDDIHPGLEEVEAAKLFTTYIHTNQVRCPKPKQLGQLDEGGWDVCITPPFNLQRNCTVYSFGVGRAWGFDDAVSTEYQCNVYAFDPTINTKQHTRLQRIYFFPIGLGGEKQKTLGKKRYPLQTYKQFLERFNHTQTVIDILKIDIEYSEWASLDCMIHDGSLVKVKQLQLEIHTEELYNERSTTAHFVYYWRLLRNLYKLGFRLWGCHDNPYGPFMKHVLPEKKISCCYELYFINLNFLE